MKLHFLLCTLFVVNIYSQHNFDEQGIIFSTRNGNVGINTDRPREMLDVRKGSIIAKGGFFEVVDKERATYARNYEEYFKYCKSLSAGEILTINGAEDNIRRFNFYDLLENNDLRTKRGSFFNIRDVKHSRLVFTSTDDGDSRFYLSNKRGEEFFKVGNLEPSHPSNNTGRDINFMHMLAPNSRISIGTWVMAKPEFELTVMGSGFFSEKIVTKDKIGVGTENPTQKLHVEFTGEGGILSKAISNGTYGASNIIVDAANGFPSRFMFREDGQNKAWFDHSHNKVNLRGAQSNPLFTVLINNGNFGIGNTNPNTKLHVNGSITMNDGNQGVNKIMTSDANGKATWTDVSSLNIQSNWTSNANHIYSNNSGNVGIGTSTPEAKLHVNGGLKARNSSFSIAPATVNNSWMRDSWLTGNHGAPSWDDNNSRWVRSNYQFNDVGGIVFQDEGTYFIRIPSDQNQTQFTNQEFLNKAFLFSKMSNGNIGMGTTNTSGFKLSVNGKIRSTEVKVYTGWADFVFSKNYVLPTLEEVEKHIKKEGHLKDIPNAEEVEKNGIFLGRMNAKLLQKIEELTLYTIQQQKEINAQVLKNKDLNDRVKKLEEMFLKLNK